MAKKNLNKREKELVQAVEFFESLRGERTQVVDNSIISDRLDAMISSLKEEVYQVAKQRNGTLS